MDLSEDCLTFSSHHAHHCMLLERVYIAVCLSELIVIHSMSASCTHLGRVFGSIEKDLVQRMCFG